MKRDSRLSSVLHALLHMAEQDGPVTSETLAQCLGTNPVVVRRTVERLADDLPGELRLDEVPEFGRGDGAGVRAGGTGQVGAVEQAPLVVLAAGAAVGTVVAWLVEPALWVPLLAWIWPLPGWTWRSNWPKGCGAAVESLSKRS